jgi:hypothetical protein
MRTGSLKAYLASLVALSMISAASATPVAYLSSAVSTSTPKAGAVCSKANQIIRTSSYQYTCVKSGHVLKWIRSARKSIPTPLPTSTPTPVASPTRINSSLTIPVNLQAIQDYANLILTWSVPPGTKVSVEFYRVHGECLLQGKSCGSYEHDVWAKGNDGNLSTNLVIPKSELTNYSGGAQWNFTLSARNQSLSFQSPLATFAPIILGASASPTPTPTHAAIPTNFSDLIANYQGIPQAAWSSYDQKIVKAKVTPVVQNIFIGPNSTLINPSVIDAFTQGDRVFDGFVQPPTIDLVYYNFIDTQWAKDKLTQLGFSNRAQEVSGSCSSLDRCNGASAGKGNDTTGFGQFALPDANGRDLYHLHGGLEIHEYTHMVQAMQFVGKPTDAIAFGTLPQWFLEGHAHVVGNLASTSTFSEYQLERAPWLQTSPNAAIKSFSPENIEYFYDALMPMKYNADLFGYVYTVGFLTLEELIAIKGIDSPMQLIDEVANGSSFEQAFNKIYGIPWSEAEPILAQAVSKELT